MPLPVRNLFAFINSCNHTASCIDLIMLWIIWFLFFYKGPYLCRQSHFIEVAQGGRIYNQILKIGGFLSFIFCNFLVQTLQYLRKRIIFLCPVKSCSQLAPNFFSVLPTGPNLIFCSITMPSYATSM